MTQIYNRIEDDILTEHEINDILNKLYPCTKVIKEEKTEHIEKAAKKYLVLKRNAIHQALHMLLQTPFGFLEPFSL